MYPNIKKCLKLRKDDLQITQPTSKIKSIKVVNKPYLKTYVPGLNIQGKYLADFGFNCGDSVNLTIENGKILIEKI